MHLLYPSDPFEKTSVDEEYAEELAAVVALGLPYSLFSFEDFETGKFSPRQILPVGAAILYRGWMMTPQLYQQFFNLVEGKGAHLKTGVREYRRCHHLPEWYPLCTEFTPETVVADKNADFASLMEGKHWPAYFVKDYVKSLTTARGSIAQTADAIAELVSLIEQYRGTIEGGVCIRKFEDLDPKTEERYFVLTGTAHARDGKVPALVEEVAKRIDSPFYCVDTILTRTGQLRLIELGDGQVSDRKKWSPEQFASILSA